MVAMLRREFIPTLASGALAQPTPKKRLIVHADDAGMCHSANAATIEALGVGLVSSSSIMLPCAWAREFTDWAKAHPEKDLGVHTTLTSEWKHYRWRPVSSIETVKGLIDDEGFIWRDVRSAATHASAAEIEREIRAQIERAKACGVAITHIDSHMGTVFARPDYFEVYTKLAREYGVLCMLPRPTEEALANLKGYPITPEQLKAKEAAGYKMIDHLVLGVGGRTPAERRDSYRKFIAELKPGVTKLIVHLAMNDSEIRAVTNNWEPRWADFLFWTSSEARELLRANDIELYTYRQLVQSA
jgi:predicted glycoside hydrolase/deacetylase ChbG (UPF0249 family)